MEWVKLCDVAEVIMGQSPKSEYCNDNKEGLPFYQGVSDFGEIFPVPTKYCTEPKKIAEIDDILIGVRAPVGDLNISNSNCCIGRGVAAIRANEKFISKKYLFYFLKTQKQYFEINSTGSTPKAINKSVLSETLVPIIDINKQKIIEDMLDRIENIIRKRKEQIQAYDDFIESLFYEMFGDPNGKSNGFKLKKLGELGRWNSGGTPKRSNKNYFTGDIPWVTSGELNDIFIHDSFEHINEEAIENSSAKLVPIGSLLLGMYDSAGLKSSISSKVLTTNQAIAFSKLDDDICNTIFVYFCIQLMRDKLLKKQRGVRQKNFNLSMIKEISIPIPPIELQNKFADYVVKIEGEKKKLRASLDELEILFDALMEDAFSGNLFKE